MDILTPSANTENTQTLFTFLDVKERSHTIPAPIKTICDTCDSVHWYLFRLLVVAGQQQEEYFGEEAHPSLIPFFDPAKHDDRIKKTTKALIRRFDQCYEGKMGNKRVQESREDLAAQITRETLSLWEAWLGVDTRGVEAGDNRPYLGVNLDRVCSLLYYYTEEMRKFPPHAPEQR